MKNFLVIVAVIFLFISILIINKPKLNIHSKLPAPGAIANSSLNVKNLKNVNYSVNIFSQSFMNWLKTKSEYKNYLDRKLVIYPTGTNCPYGRGLENAVRKIIPLYEGKYNYYANVYSGGEMYKNATFENLSDMEEYKTFIHICKEFCVINPYNNQIFSIEGVKTREINMFEDIFKSLDNW